MVCLGQFVGLSTAVLSRAVLSSVSRASLVEGSLSHQASAPAEILLEEEDSNQLVDDDAHGAYGCDDCCGSESIREHVSHLRIGKARSQLEMLRRRAAVRRKAQKTHAHAHRRTHAPPLQC